MRQNKKIRLEEVQQYVDQGWELGRVMKFKRASGAAG